jgi:hypothetical protein
MRRLTSTSGDSRGTALLAEALHQLDVVTQARRTRLVLARGVVPGLLWFALFGGAVVTIGFTLFFGTKDLRLQAIMTGILSFLIFSGVLEEIRSRPDQPWIVSWRDRSHHQCCGTGEAAPAISQASRSGISCCHKLYCSGGPVGRGRYSDRWTDWPGA